jgi:ATP-dependent exoDNAse (exonuclease V) beta subunit
MTILADAAKRSRALDPAESFHLEAPAGSGKTFLLTARFLRLLGLVAHPRQILALTFTNKAAGEMLERVREYLNRAKKGVDPRDAADEELLDFAAKALLAHKDVEQLLLAGDILRIQTFHSFCNTVASQAPLEAGIAPGSTLLDENEQKFFLRETVSEALREIADRKSDDPARRALKDRLLYLNNSWWLLSGEMEDLTGRREGLIDLVQVLTRDRATGYLAERIRELVESELNALKLEFQCCTLGNCWVDFLKFIEDAGAAAACSLPARIPPSQWESLGEWLCLAQTFLTAEGKVRKQLGPKSGFYSGFVKTEWGEALQNLPPGAVEKLARVRDLPSFDTPVKDPETLWDLVLLLHAVLEVYDDRCRARRALDFSALEMAALRIFDATGPSDLQLILDQQIRHILVDEFQDTSRGQWDLLQKLCSGWSDGDGRTLFLVGDPKQSIYGFRKAEVRLFMNAAQGLPLENGGKLSLGSLVLDTNFRSQPHLIDWCNGIFGETVMAAHKPEFDEVPFSPAVISPATHVYPNPACPELALFLEWPDRESARIREAEWLAGRIARDIEENGRDHETAVLLFSRTHLPVYLEALQRRRIPIQVKEGLKLVERPEVRYLHQLCRGIVLPQDDLAWAAQLRSPWLVVDFDRILAISREDPEPWVEKIRSFSGTDEEVSKFWEALNGAWQHVGHEPLAKVVEAAWLDLDGARIVGENWGSRGLNCCRRFLDILGKAEEGEPVRTLQRLEQLLENAYEPVDPDTASSNVFLSTIHGAKGLEYDTVFIPFLDWNPVFGRKGQPPPFMLERSPQSGEYLLAPRPDRLMGTEDPLYNLLRNLRSKRQLGEAKRLFYVAATRARREIVMSAVARKKGAGFTTGRDTPLAWLNEHYSLEDLAGLGDMDIGGQVENVPIELLRNRKRRMSSDDGRFSVQIEPDGCSAAVPEQHREPVEIVPAQFEREKPAFKVLSPSSLTVFEDESQFDGPKSSCVPPCAPALWGTLIHRLLAEFGKTGLLPSAEKTAFVLKREAIGTAEAGKIALEALSEVESCLADPWLNAFYAVPFGSRRVEWPLECAHGENEVYSGIIDLAVEIQGRWTLVDFKTSRPAGGESMDDFQRREMDVYRAQLEAYREMWAKWMSIAANDVDVFLFWTALRKAEKMVNGIVRL